MPVDRLLRRRRSSAARVFKPAKPGYYGIPLPTSRPVTFAPNVTPVSYVAPDSESQPGSPEPGSPTSKLFPPSELPPSLPSRRRVPPGKRRSMGYIPRPPNAFMLFRADFVRQKHVPGSIETNHGSLSKIIGNCWRALPPDEKKIWELKARQAKADHKAQYPEYRFRPVHNKNKDKKKEKPASTVEDERRCEEVAQFLLEGKKGDELAAAVRHLDNQTARAATPSGYQYRHRRSSSVPLPNDWYPGIALPAPPFNSLMRSESPAYGMSRGSRAALGHRRASSAQPMVARNWSVPVQGSFQRDESPLPEADTSLFEQSFLNTSGFSSFGGGHPQDLSFGGMGYTNSSQDLSLGPLDTMTAYPLSYQNGPVNHPQLDPMTWLPVDPGFSAVQPQSHTSSLYSGSPAPSDNSLPVHAPQPQLALQTDPTTFVDNMWKDYSMDHMQMQMQHQQLSHQQMQQVHQQSSDLAHTFEHSLDLSQTSACTPLGDFSQIENFLDPNYDINYGFEFNHDVVQP